MRKIVVLCCVFLLSILTSAKDALPTAKEEFYFLQNAIDRIIQQVDPNAHIGIEIVSLKNGQKLYERNAKQKFVPASVQKIFTAAAALSILGPEYRFETKLYTQKEIKAGVLNGDLFLKGVGDPSLTSADLQDLAFQLARTGVKVIKGDLAIDNFDFDQITLGPGWMWDEGAEYWNSPIDALLVNHSCVTVWVEPGAQENLPARVTLTPEVEGVTILNLTKTTPRKGEIDVRRRWMTKENLIEVGGNIELNSPAEQYEIPVESPSLYAALLFRDFLAEQGIQIEGEVVYKKTPAMRVQ